MRVRLVLQEQHGAVFIGDMTKPVMVIARLARESKPGYLALGGFVPAGAPGDGPSARFTNVVIRPDVVPFDLKQAVSSAPAPQAPPVSARVVRAWSVSRAFVPKDSHGEPPALPGADVLGEFRRLETDASGLLELHRHVRVPEKSSVAAAVARVRVRATRAGTYAFDLGFSDVATVFVNDRPLFRGDASYSFDRPRREGLIGFDQARLYVPLRAGDNELAILLSDSFGGWGLMGRFVAADGLTLVDPGV
jgi:hypothetical protein